VPVESRVKLSIYDVLGQAVRTLVDRTESVGDQSVQWNASTFGSGIYFYRLEATSTTDPGKTFRQVKKMVLMK